jgi:tripartite-type tricarboxylate transporter receptor subunit TctC
LAADYPAKAVRFIAPSSPGSGVDIVSRLVAQRLATNVGQQVVVENRAGAGGNLGAEVASKAPPDGYTVFIATPSHAINKSLYRKLNYDTLQDFLPVTQLIAGQYVLVTHPSLPAKTVKELVMLARAKRGELNYASAGKGNATHLAGELFKSLAKIDIVHVPYKGSGPALVDLISGQVHLMFPNLVNTLPHVKAGKLRALGVTGPKRTTAAPDIPTISEAGLAGYSVTSWYGAMVPAGTPQAIVGQLNAEIARVLNAPDVKDKLASQGADVVASSPQEFLAFLKEEMSKYDKVVRGAGIKPE